MYFLNNACNGVLYYLDKTSFVGDSVQRGIRLKPGLISGKGMPIRIIGSIYYAA